MHLLVQVTDDQCSDGECWAHRIDIETDKAELMTAIAVFYPTAHTIHLEIEEDSVEEG